MIPLSLLVFFASITVPMLKILSLGWMISQTWRGRVATWWRAPVCSGWWTWWAGGR
ncbi:paraquat-inducible protein A [Komagataeibacter rhaeticus]|nr:paraquat-inducible protein A [Komagataeibacter rhaeticus]